MSAVEKAFTGEAVDTGEGRAGALPLSRPAQTALHIALLVASILLALGGVEVALRLSTPREIMRYFFVTSDTTLHHRFIPGATGRYQSTEFNTSYRISSAGLRDREFAVPKPGGTFRILMLGDSFTEGDGVEGQETFSKRLESMLADKFGVGRVEVVNAGVGSYSPILEYLYLKNGGLALEPDMVILNYDLSDAFDDITYSKLARFSSDGVPLGVAAPEAEGENRGLLVRVKDFFKDHTRLYNFVRVRIDRYLEGARHEGNFSGDLQHDKYAMLRGNYHATASDWDLSQRYLLMIRDTLRSRNIDFAVNLYPYGMQASTREWAVGRRFWGFRSDTLYSTWPQDHIERFCRDNGIGVTNMCSEFRDTARAVFPLYWPDNGHWKPRGHLVAAELLRRDLEPIVASRLKGSSLER
ncbi:MAG TPA: SGNH/GDSL hydrolase family protein [Bacteroidota bacterium]|nr:SGNH/GDSL hydrolase family protein [Bacteroidota bacterium]